MSLTELPLGLTGRIFRSPMPFGDRDLSGRLFREYQEHGISVIVLLTEEEESRIRTGFDLKRFYQENGMRVHHLPIPDFGTPSMKEVEALIPEILESASKGRHIVIHCFAGIGRTGLVAVEINYTFYRMPNAKTIAGWNAETPAAFTFALKVSKRITHADAHYNLCLLFEGLGKQMDAIRHLRKARVLYGRSITHK